MITEKGLKYMLFNALPQELKSINVLEIFKISFCVSCKHNFEINLLLLKTIFGALS